MVVVVVVVVVAAEEVVVVVVVVGVEVAGAGVSAGFSFGNLKRLQ